MEKREQISNRKSAVPGLFHLGISKTRNEHGVVGSFVTLQWLLQDVLTMSVLPVAWPVVPIR